MSITEAIKNAKTLISTIEWPRSIQDFPKGSTLNCWGFALDNLKVPSLQKFTYYSDLNGLDKEVFDFLQDIGLKPRKIYIPEEKSPEEMVFLFYIFEYHYFNMVKEDYGTRSECHVARIETDGTVVEKADATEEPIITSLSEIKQRLFNENGVNVDPIMIAVRKPH